MKELTIITVCYNSVNTIARCIDSIATQMDCNVEYIIIDGASNDGTLDIIKDKAKQYPIRYYSEPDNGIYHAMNKGAKRAEGKWLWFVNSDDYIHNNIVRQIIEYIHKADIEFDCIYGNIEFVKLYKGIEFIKKGIPEVSQNMLVNDTIFHPSFLCRIEIYLQEGGFNESYKTAADWDFIIRLYIKGCSFSYYPHVMTTFYTGGTSSNSHVVEKFNIRKQYNSLYIAFIYLLIDIFKTCLLNVSEKLFRNKIMKWRIRNYKMRITNT